MLRLNCFNWMVSRTVIRSGLILPLLLAGCMADNSALTSPAPIPAPANGPQKSFLNSIGMPFVYVDGGSFRMGERDDAFGGDVIHEVAVTGFWMGRFEVTNREYALFKKPPYPSESLTPLQPVTPVRWQDATNFCRWLSAKEGRTYRLPTEAEWEYAARGGLDQKQYPWGNQEPHGKATFGTTVTTIVGKYPPNGYGLHDMAGNVSEWVSDWFSDSYYAKSPRLNPQGPKQTEGKLATPPEDEWKIVRGGSFIIEGLTCGRRDPAYLGEVTPVGAGFRVVMEPEVKRKNRSRSESGDLPD